MELIRSKNFSVLNFDLYIEMGVDKLDDKQIRRRYLKGNKTVLQNCNCEKIDKSERN